jgi:hypothetical protein
MVRQDMVKTLQDRGIQPPIEFVASRDFRWIHISTEVHRFSIHDHGAVTQMSNQKYRLLPAPIYIRALTAARREIVSPNPSTCGGVIRPCRALGSGVRKTFQLHDSTLRTARADIRFYIAVTKASNVFPKFCLVMTSQCKKPEVYQ